MPKTVLKTIYEQTNQFRQRSRTTDYRKRYWGNKQDGKKKHFYRRNGLAIPISCSFSSFFFLSEQDSSLRLSDHSHPGDSETDARVNDGKKYCSKKQIFFTSSQILFWKIGRAWLCKRLSHHSYLRDWL